METERTEESRPAKSSWREPQTVVSLVIACIALAALFGSVCAISQSSRALNISEEEFISKRLAVWGGLLNENNDDLILRSLNSDASLQSAAVLFPPQVDESEWAVGPPNFALPLTILRLRIQDVIDENIPRRSDYIVGSGSNQIPIILTSHYIAQGKAYSDQSLYGINYSFWMGEEQYIPPRVTFQGLVFLQRMNSLENPSEYLGKLFDGVVGD